MSDRPQYKPGMTIEFREGMTYEEFEAQLTADQLNAKRGCEEKWFKGYGVSDVPAAARFMFDTLAMMVSLCYCGERDCDGWAVTAKCLRPHTYPIGPTGGLGCEEGDDDAEGR